MDNLANVQLTAALTKAGLSAGTTSTLTTTATVQYMIRGKMYSKAAITNSASPIVDFTTGLPFVPLSANQGTIVVIGYDAAGNVRASQGNIQPLDINGNFLYAPQYPALLDNFAPIGYIVLKAGATLSGTFTFGTNNLSGVTGMTYTFQDVGMLTDRPQVA